MQFDVYVVKVEIQLDAAHPMEKKLNAAPLTKQAAVQLADAEFEKATKLKPGSTPGLMSKESGFQKTKQILSSQKFKYQYYMGSDQVGGTPTGWNDYDKSTWNRLTSLYANRTGLVGTPIRVKSGSHGFTYELTFVDPGHAEVKHSFSGAPITFTDERELVIGVQMNTQTKTMRTIRQVLMEEAAPKKEKKAETAQIPDVSDAFTPTAQGFKSEMINKGVEWSQLEAASTKAKGMLHVPLEERMAAYAYTLDSPCLHGELNAKLRKAGGPMPLPAGFENCTSYLERSIQSLPLPSGQDLKAPLYRGQPELYGVAYQADDIVVWPAFTSTTTEYATAEAFRSQEGSHQGVLFEVFGINEKDGGGLAPISKFPCEAEILVQAGTAFRVLEKTMSGNKKVIKLAKVDS